MKHLNLPNDWTVVAVGDTSHVPAEIIGREIPATVPGCVHTDLLAAGLIPDPYVSDHELKVQWIGRTDWRYAGTFTLTAADLDPERIDLAFDGLDTIAAVELNGQPVGRTDNMHRRYRFDVGPALREGTNELTITFAAALPHAEAVRDERGELPATGNGSNPQRPHNFIRKMACNFGWDWGPALTTAGIWRDVRLEAWDAARLADVRPATTGIDEDGRATLEVHVDHEPPGSPGSPADGVTLHATLSGHGFSDEQTVPLTPDTTTVTFTVDHADLWYPVGHGDQSLYDLTVTLQTADGQTLDTRTHHVGLRTCTLATPEDPPAPTPPPGHADDLPRGSGMTLHVNGKPVFCKGANWIPDDCFPSRLTRDRLRDRITKARDANMNMLRVWGGGTYESHDFYELCDELGLLVWQDFLMACAAYVEDEPFFSSIREEARDNVARLAYHPSLVMWCGNNENLWAYDEWPHRGKKNWREFLGDRGWGPKYYFDVFPKVVADLAPTTPYWPGSPYSGPTEPTANAPHRGDVHLWDVWHGSGQYRNYLGHAPRFASEFGYHGPPTWPNLADSVPPDHWAWDSPGMNHHNKNSSDRPGQAQTHQRMADDFVPPVPPPDSSPDSPEARAAFDDWLYLAQIMQARALAMGVAWFRALHPYCSGALYWQFNDCWPVSSWSALDSHGHPKPLWYATRRFFAPRLLTIRPRKTSPSATDVGPLALYAHNDRDTPWQTTIHLHRCDLQGNPTDTQTLTLDVPPRDVQRLDVPDPWHDDPEQHFLTAQPPNSDDTVNAVAPAFWWFAPDKAIAYPEAEFDTTLTHAPGIYTLTVTAHSLLRDLCVFADRLDPAAEVSDQCVTLLPGQSHAFTIRSRATLTQQALTAPPVLQTVNRFGRPATAAP
ncbi:MAG: glycoside hydrolase family 2 protein [Planctomycetota bacterium]